MRIQLEDMTRRLCESSSFSDDLDKALQEKKRNKKKKCLTMAGNLTPSNMTNTPADVLSYKSTLPWNEGDFKKELDISHNKANKNTTLPNDETAGSKPKDFQDNVSSKFCHLNDVVHKVMERQMSKPVKKIVITGAKSLLKTKIPLTCALEKSNKRICNPDKPINSRSDVDNINKDSSTTKSSKYDFEEKKCKKSTQDFPQQKSAKNKSPPYIPPFMQPGALRPIVIDGNSVATAHGHSKLVFSAKGICLCVQHFQSRGHMDVRVFIPHFKMPSNDTTPSSKILEDLQKKYILVPLPPRIVNDKIISSSDPRTMLQLAVNNYGILVSNENYNRELGTEIRSYREVLKNRLLNFKFNGDQFVIPEDGLGPDKVDLEAFLTFH